ncbi:MAG: 23S rRNA (guanosine(2251)-2'-O)-methyltransferase RlmB [Oscillospiraceae bacterium]|jgi:23S rRNA (guanosine2251-2'-O)-methyltransferase|nr:23S rRNA (guanosine(2251)-2'-O)-methyltransferase RlmB [Oscillospiraceae bacterium]
MTESSTTKIEGRNAVLEAIRAGRTIDRVYVASGGDKDRSMGRIIALAKSAGAVISDVDRRKLDQMSETGAHQGVIAVASEYSYSTIAEILAIASERGEPPLLVICDEISDPHNLGAIMRSAEGSGAHGVVIPKRRSAGFSSAVVEKSSAGAISHIAVARVANISAAIRELKSAGVWVCGADSGSGSTLWERDFTPPIAFVVGSEGEGLGRLVAENCDYLVRIPMFGKVESLNASNAAAILLYETARQRSLKQ